MTSQEEPQEEARRFITERTPKTPDVGVVLGSGLGSFTDSLTDQTCIPYRDIPNMPESKVVGHAGNLCVGQLGDVRVACLQGRVHLYEGHEPERVVFGVRLLAELGCRAVLLTNAAGGIRPRFVPGDLMLITDHINLSGQNPLTGPNDEEQGPRFPDLSRAYDNDLCQAARQAAKELGVELREGVYAAMPGPSYETPAEVRMLGAIGADAVGMSTVPEVIALRHRGVRVGAISCITNLAAGIATTTLDHAEVEQTARQSREAFVRLLSRWIELAHEATKA
jgi:purine-nucleoside phosphorylase